MIGRDQSSTNKTLLTKEQSIKIQILRGLAIIAVVFIHNTPGGVAQVWIRPLLNFGVGLFLFLSGLLSSAERWNPIKRIIKVIIPYFIWTLVYVLIADVTNPINIPMDYIRTLILANSAAVMYYIFVYCQFTLLIPIIDRLAHNRFFYLGFLIAPLEIIVMRYIPLYTGITINKYILYVQNISCLGWFSYFYMGYLIGNKLININISTIRLVLMWIFSIVLQMIEGYFQFTMGEVNCGTQLKLTSILSGSLFVLLAYRYIMTNKWGYKKYKALEILGNDSFGIYFSHLAVMTVLQHLPYYSQYILFPLNGLITIFITFICIEVGKNILGKYARYFAL